MKMEKSYILIKGARQHNLKNINISIPKNEITAITGVSGSGKSSLAYDTLFEQGRAMYLEALSPKAPRFSRPNVDHISGLMPPIAINQKMNADTNPRSTVGTILQINTYLRLLFSLVGETFCPKCNNKIEPESRCPQCGFFAGKNTPNMFSFNHINGMCPCCNGLGKITKVSEDLIIPDKELSLQKLKSIYEKNNVFSYVARMFDSVFEYLGVNAEIKYGQLSNESKDFLLYGSKEKIEVHINGTKTGLPGRDIKINFPGIIPHVERVYKETTSNDRRMIIEQNYMQVIDCPECNGKRLNKRSLCVKINNLDFAQLLNLPIKDLNIFFNIFRKSYSIEDNPHIYDVINDITRRLDDLIQVGLDYLTLDRETRTLSGGESQRIRLANHLSSDLSGILYIFDEPSAGLHSKDIEQVFTALKRLKENGNTIVVIEHDKYIIQRVDHVIDIGPYAGIHGGKLVAFGTIKDICANSNSLTGTYLSRQLKINELPPPRTFTKSLYIKNAHAHNLKNIDAQIPLNCFVAITGISGSGKSSLVYDVLYKRLKKYLSKGVIIGKDEEVLGAEFIKDVIYISQEPMARNQRSNIATYTNLFDRIRKIFSETQMAKEKGLNYSHFSTNSGNGRCPKCKGLGYNEQDMYFLPSIDVECDECNGKRYQQQILDIKYKGYNISEILDMTIEEGLNLLEHDITCKNIINTLMEIGLGYVKFGQCTSTLSGGECQRLKLVNELYNKKTDVLYIFDEPSRGLHFFDIEKLLTVINKLIDAQNSVIIIEHNLDIIIKSDYIIDLGPNSGNDGGQIIAQGTPTEFIQKFNTYTANSLRKEFGG